MSVVEVAIEQSNAGVPFGEKLPDSGYMVSVPMQIRCLTHISLSAPAIAAWSDGVIMNVA